MAKQWEKKIKRSRIVTKNKHFAHKYFDDFGLFFGENGFFYYSFTHSDSAHHIQVCAFFISIYALNIDLHSMRLKLLFILF